MISILKVNDRIFCFSVEKSGDFLLNQHSAYFLGVCM